MKWRVLAVVVVALIGAACSDTEGTTTTGGVSSADDVVFGEGELPETIPGEFSLPTGSAIGSTMVVTKTGFTEVIVRIMTWKSSSNSLRSSVLVCRVSVIFICRRTVSSSSMVCADRCADTAA